MGDPPIPGGVPLSPDVPGPGRSPDPSSTRSRLHAGKAENRCFAWLCRLSVWISVGLLGVLLFAVGEKAVGWLDWQFISSFDSRRPANAGLLAGILGTAWVIAMTILFAVPIGVGAAVYLEELAPKTWLTRTIQVNLANLAGVPSIVYGLLGLTVFVRMFSLFGPHGLLMKWTGRSVEGLFWSTQFKGYLIPLPFGRVAISGALTMTLLILPVIIIASQEALRAVPPSLRHASLALGATRWQTIRYQVLPAALPGIMTGLILSISRAIGETAPLIIIGAASFARFAPGGIDSWGDMVSNPEGVLKAPFDIFTAMTLQIYFWIRMPNPDFKHVAAAGIVVLLLLLLVLNGVAILIRNRSARHARW